MTNKEYKVGETFQIKNVKLQVKNANADGGCKGCYFYVGNDCCAICSIGACSRFTREDKTNVIFVKVEE